jgi:hypothetical protein
LFTYLEQTHALGTGLAHHPLELLAHHHHTGGLPDWQSTVALARCSVAGALYTNPAYALVTQLTLKRLAAIPKPVDQRIKLATLMLHLKSLAREVLEVACHSLELVLERVHSRVVTTLCT